MNPKWIFQFLTLFQYDWFFWCQQTTTIPIYSMSYFWLPFLLSFSSTPSPSLYNKNSHSLSLIFIYAIFCMALNSFVFPSFSIVKCNNNNPKMHNSTGSCSKYFTKFHFNIYNTNTHLSRKSWLRIEVRVWERSCESGMSLYNIYLWVKDIRKRM